MKHLLVTLSVAFLLSGQAFAESAHVEELDPTADDIAEQLLENEKEFAPYRLEEAPRFDLNNIFSSSLGVSTCFRETCPVYLEVSRKHQRAVLRINGEIINSFDGDIEWLVTTGGPGHTTPAFDQAIASPLRAYSKYSSSKYPGGDWNGLGNMPYAVFIRLNKGWAVHGTTPTGIKNLGRPLGNGFAGSHGCIRTHPLNGKKFNEAVRKYGASQSWIYMVD